jgi:hypothetical protein
MVLLALCLSTLAGCGKKAADSAATNAQPTPEQVAQIESEYILPTNQNDAAASVATTPSRDGVAPGAGPVRTVVPIQQRLQGAIHARLTIELRRYIEKYGRMPDSFSEFANAMMDSVPEAPEGMKFAIDPVDKAVKAVKK